MSRADELRAKYEAELAVLELEEELVVAKDSDDPETLRDVKDRLRETRRVFREQRAGDATVSPATIETTAGVPSPGSVG